MVMRKSLIIEQFVSGLGNQVLKRHAQFAHLYTLDRTISIVVEFEDFEGVNVQYRIPIPDETVTSVNAIKQSSNTEHIDLKSANWRNRLTTCMTQMANITKSQSPNRRHFRNNRHNYRTSKEGNTCKQNRTCQSRLPTDNQGQEHVRSEHNGDKTTAKQSVNLK
jgi:hypothetical protein